MLSITRCVQALRQQQAFSRQYLANKALKAAAWPLISQQKIGEASIRKICGRSTAVNKIFLRRNSLNIHSRSVAFKGIHAMSSASSSSALEVCRFWFGEKYPQDIINNYQMWYQGGPDIDNQIKTRFGALVESALNGELDSWATGDLTHRLALIILLDQFTRNVYRGSGKAFSGDDKALSVALSTFAKVRKNEKNDEGEGAPSLPLRFFERAFGLMPLMHAESKDVQKASVEAFKTLAEDFAGTDAEGASKNTLDFAIKHADIVEKFGRYPHRNDALGRPTSEEETAYLINADRFGQ